LLPTYRSGFFVPSFDNLLIILSHHHPQKELYRRQFRHLCLNNFNYQLTITRDCIFQLVPVRIDKLTVEKDNRLNILLEEAMIDLLEKYEEESE
jgi:hypothetical protein